MTSTIFFTFLMSIFSHHLHADVINFEMIGGIPDDMSEDTAWLNGDLMNKTLEILMPGDIFVVPNKTFKMIGGIEARNLNSVTIQIDGTLFVFM